MASIEMPVVVHMDEDEVLRRLKEMGWGPEKHGRWVNVPGYATPGGDPVWKCSECGKGVHVYGIEHGTYGAEVADGQWVSCPNCGARMDGDDGPEVMMDDRG